MRIYTLISLTLIGGALLSCSTNERAGEQLTTDITVLIEAESFNNESSKDIDKSDVVELSANEWLAYEINVPATGRYRIEARCSSAVNGSIWIEDYFNNKDERTYDITGKMNFMGSEDDSFRVISKEGSPLKAGRHEIKLHNTDAHVSLDWIKLTLMKEHKVTPKVFEQKMDGEEWSLVWSDEFNGNGLPDTTKWAYNIGNWGWGNNEPQYYTEFRKENARQEDGNLIIEAHKNDLGEPWTSARLTTQGQASFLYGKVEFRAKVPVGRGTWSAGWLLGDSYEDELSWPYCGEIDVLECVGYEIDNETGDGLNHATCHTRAYYFKQDNQIGSEKVVESMNSKFHTYAIEWYPDVIYGLVDGERYYTYDKNKDELEWPFFNPQNIILNLAVGGGWGGAKGIDESWESHQFIIDYVRVYELN
jgi:beta-glucanase (GH16 family)